MDKNLLMKNKRGLIMGVANNHSIAWGIAKQIFAQGGDLAFTYVGDTLHKRVNALAQAVNSNLVFPCDVTKEEEIQQLFCNLQQEWGSIDFIVHAIAFADRKELSGKYYNTTKANFLNSLDISCYSLTSVARAALPLMQENGGSILTLTYFASQKVVPNYNVMGVAKAALETSVKYLAADLGESNIRVNALSAGPVKTLAASGIAGFRTMLNWTKQNSPMRRNVTLDEIGSSGLYLLSDLASAVTGESHHVDCGYNIIGMQQQANNSDDQ